MAAAQTAILLLFFCAALPSGVFASPQDKNSAPASAATKTVKPKAKAAPKKRTINTSALLMPPVTYKYNEPGDLINLFPLLKQINEMIPRQFSLADHEFVLDTNRVVIRHSFYDTPRAKISSKLSVVSFTYSGNVGRAFATNLDVPLFYSSVFGFSDWSRYPLGNYTMTLSRDSFLADTYYIRAITRF